jgi:hypothetical protein
MAASLSADRTAVVKPVTHSSFVAAMIIPARMKTTVRAWVQSQKGFTPPRIAP